MAAVTPFWKAKTLAQMNQQEWESLCDGCGRCCLQKLLDDETEEVFYTRVICRYLDADRRCSCYESRHIKVPECVWLKPEDVEQFHWLPTTCSYRLIAEGKELPDWHPLVSGRPDSVADAGIAVTCQPLVKDDEVPEDDWQEHIIQWVEQ
ncbi:YcgN family cysteine cluster protein [Gynuella sp.]|uniref:YcgN family cysteine cluster protein n=1 Tax=Gynuella sp. TaxID=2969146 RepID=UPI003D0F558F